MIKQASFFAEAALAWAKLYRGADIWSDQTYDPKSPAWMRFGDDCTGFVSGCMWHGGWPMEYPEGDHYFPDRNSTAYWFAENSLSNVAMFAVTHNLKSGGGISTSKSWRSAAHFVEFAVNSGRVTQFYTPTKFGICEDMVKILRRGDVIGEWSELENMHHLMIMESIMPNPWDSTFLQHSSDKSRKSWQELRDAKNNLPHEKFYVFRPKETFWWWHAPDARAPREITPRGRIHGWK